MHWLFPVVLLSFGFGQLFKWSQRRGHSAPVVVSTNYIVLASTLALYFLITDVWPPSSPALFVGVITGITFIASMLIMTYALGHINAATTLTSFRLAIVVPILFGIGLWGERATPLQFLGIFLALLSLFLLTWRQTNDSGKNNISLICLVFILQGLSQCCLRWVHYAQLDPERLHVLMVTAFTAGLLGALYVFLRGISLRKRDIFAGAGIGLFNLAALSVILTALVHIQGTVFFPLSGCGVVLLDNIFAHFIWREPLGRMGLAGAILGAFSMILIV